MGEDRNKRMYVCRGWWVSEREREREKMYWGLEFSRLFFLFSNFCVLSVSSFSIDYKHLNIGSCISQEVRVEPVIPFLRHNSDIKVFS